MTALSREGDNGRLLRGLLAGAVAGVAASVAMDAFQAQVAKLGGRTGGGEPATERAADALAQAATGSDAPDSTKPLAGQAVHYATGLALGAAYGVAAAFRPEVTAGFGTAFAVGTAAVLDEGVVPALGLSDAPWRTPPGSHLMSLGAHLVFGVTTEAARRIVDRTLQPA